MYCGVDDVNGKKGNALQDNSFTPSLFVYFLPQKYWFREIYAFKINICWIRLAEPQVSVSSTFLSNI